ncbi:conserved hypothetical protein [Theileria orientalis strain Shintoku]|uniref:Leucine-rich repeat protein n=1 Tax=Theileria orientalis strain Shintoku TaxID=869250 RepID=J4CCT7_THEOR|nr:conserved hypothetical protein [Theileria orientalis strain Shintoku]BAM39962.1 conserved hypothetical protein [Theileria orientalis strain Shintoku]|eukprot:XP_009690263.1 conserved hypothetical protein [Theileria orientalis strain Shintoku]
MLLDLSGRKLCSLHDNFFVVEELARNNLRFEDITELDVTGCGLDDLFGIDLFKNLKTLVASYNKIFLLDPLVSLDLKKIVLDNNNVEQLYVKQLKNGMTVLSSDPDNDYTQRFLNFTLRVDGNGQVLRKSELEYVDLSNNKIKFIKNMAFDRKLSIKVLNLCNNNISDFSGLESIVGLNRLDVSSNEEFDMKHLERFASSDQCKINLQSTRLTNEYMVPYLLDRYENMVIHHETDKTYHDRLRNPYNLHLNRLKNKRFTKSYGEYAGFLYEGEASPMELLTPRYVDAEKASETAHCIQNPANMISQLETQSTVDNVDDKLSSMALNNELNYQYHYNEYQGLDEYETGKIGIEKVDKLISDPKELDFLISSTELCKKIDMWSDDIKNSLYNHMSD